MSLVGSADKLRSNMSDLGVHSSVKGNPYPDQAHHCICVSTANKFKVGKWKFAAVAKKCGYDINNAPNGILLPSEFGTMRWDNLQRHRGYHSKAYRSVVESELEKLQQQNPDPKVCKGSPEADNILGGIEGIESYLVGKVRSRKLWLYGWSEELYNNDYREEGTGNLTSNNHGPNRGSGLQWVKDFPKPTSKYPKAIRKIKPGGKLNADWYKGKGFPVPGDPNS